MSSQTPIMQRPILRRVEYHVSALPIERLFVAEDAIVTRAYGVMVRNGIRTIGDLMQRRAEVPKMKGVGLGTWNIIIGCMMDFDARHGTKLRYSFTDNP